MARLVARFDDIHPRMNWPNFERFIDGMGEAGQVGLLGVIPDCRDEKLAIGPERSDFWDVIRQLAASGWTVAQHGYTHVYDSSGASYLGTRNRSEFAGHPFEVQADRLERGAAILERESLATDVFMAPGHSFDRVTLKALASRGFKYVTDGYGLWPYAIEGVTLVPQLVSGAHGLPFGVYTSCFHLDRMSEEGIDRALACLSGHQVIPFRDAARVRPVPVLSGVARLGTGFALRKLRARRA